MLRIWILFGHRHPINKFSIFGGNSMDIVIMKSNIKYNIDTDKINETVTELTNDIAGGNTIPVIFSLSHARNVFNGAAFLPIEWRELYQIKNIVCGELNEISVQDNNIIFHMSIKDKMVEPLLQDAMDHGIRLSDVVTPAILKIDDYIEADLANNNYVNIRIDVPDVGELLLHAYFHRLYENEIPVYWLDDVEQQKREKEARKANE